MFGFFIPVVCCPELGAPCGNTRVFNAHVFNASGLDAHGFDARGGNAGAPEARCFDTHGAMLVFLISHTGLFH